MADINTQIEQRIQSFVSELNDLVRKAALEAVSNALSGGAAPAPVKRGPGRPPSAKPAAAPAPAAAKPAKRGAGKRIRRTPEQIAAAVTKVYQFIKSNPNQRSEKIREALKIDRPTMRDALDRLGADKKIKIKGVKRAATYTVA